MFGMTPALRKVLIPALKDDYSLSSWIYLGAFLQSVIFLVYPYRVTVLPSVLVILYRVATTLLMQNGVIADPLQRKAVAGRSIAQVVNPDGSIPKKLAANHITVFVLGACYNGLAKGRIRQDGSHELRKMFADMWVEASEDAEKWGFLGKTSALYASDEPNTNIATWISYWRSVEDLQAFARGSSHMTGLKWWTKNKREQIGLMHETYSVPAGNWENMYINFRPFGLGDSRQPYTTSTGETGFTSGLVPARGFAHSSLKARMGHMDHEPFGSDEAELKGASG